MGISRGFRWLLRRQPRRMTSPEKDLPTMPLDWTPFLDLVRRHQRFLLLTHIRPDGDALGSQLAMAEALEQCGKTVRVVIGSRMPDRYLFMDPNKRIEKHTASSDCYRTAEAI